MSEKLLWGVVTQIAGLIAFTAIISFGAGYFGGWWEEREFVKRYEAQKDSLSKLNEWLVNALHLSPPEDPAALSEAIREICLLEREIATYKTNIRWSKNIAWTVLILGIPLLANLVRLVRGN